MDFDSSGPHLDPELVEHQLLPFRIANEVHVPAAARQIDPMVDGLLVETVMIPRDHDYWPPASAQRSRHQVCDGVRHKRTVEEVAGNENQINLAAIGGATIARSVSRAESSSAICRSEAWIRRTGETRPAVDRRDFHQASPARYGPTASRNPGVFAPWTLCPAFSTVTNSP